VGVLGASGYAGRELCALVNSHPRLSLAFATANEQRGQTVRVGGRAVTFQGPDDVALDSAAVVFCALPHGASLPWVTRAREAGARVVDLSSDLRPGHGGGDAVYGMPELRAGANGALLRDQIRSADVVANPGMLSHVDPARARAARPRRSRCARCHGHRELRQRSERSRQHPEA
jgi:N-acetyl-gamma-glutamyl-phosphate reductase